MFLCGVILRTAKFVKYFGVTLDEKGSLRPHTVNKAEQKMFGLTKLMLNVKGPRSGKKAVLGSALHNLLLHGTLILKKAIYI